MTPQDADHVKDTLVIPYGEEGVAPRAKRHRRHANPFTVRHDMSQVTCDGLFDRVAPVAIDVGCGPGLFVEQLAAAHPEWNVLGLEIRPHLVAETLQRARLAGHANVRCVLANASLHLPAMVAPQQLVFLSVNFPDPWYKKRHHKRRVVDEAWLASMGHAFAPGAMVHAMSDYLPIAEQMRSVLRQARSFDDLHPGPHWPTTSTTGLTSEREQTHLGRNEPIYRMQFRHRG